MGNFEMQMQNSSGILASDQQLYITIFNIIFIICIFSHLEHPAEGSLTDVPDVNDVVARILEDLELGVERRPGGVVVGVLGQLGQVDVPILDLGHHIPGLVATQAVAN